LRHRRGAPGGGAPLFSEGRPQHGRQIAVWPRRWFVHPTACQRTVRMPAVASVALVPRRTATPPTTPLPRIHNAPPGRVLSTITGTNPPESAVCPAHRCEVAGRCRQPSARRWCPGACDCGRVCRRRPRPRDEGVSPRQFAVSVLVRGDRHAGAHVSSRPLKGRRRGRAPQLGAVVSTRHGDARTTAPSCGSSWTK